MRQIPKQVRRASANNKMKTKTEFKINSVEEARELINELNAFIEEKENETRSKNEILLRKEICNLMDGVGEGFKEGDYYAPNRYYSSIPGVKNIRISYGFSIPDSIHVKVLSPSGYLLPRRIEVRGNEYDVEIDKSSKFRSSFDY